MTLKKYFFRSMLLDKVLIFYWPYRLVGLGRKLFRPNRLFVGGMGDHPFGV